MNIEVQDDSLGLDELTRLLDSILAEWSSLVCHYFDELTRVGQVIAQNPHSRSERVIESVPLAKSRRVDTRKFDRILRSSVKRVGGLLPGTDVQLPDRVPEVVKRATFDTLENRYLKVLLLEVHDNLVQIMHTAIISDEDASISVEQKFFNTVTPEARRMLKELLRFLSLPFLRDVRTVLSVSLNPLIFGRYPHYARFIQIARLLNDELSFGVEMLQISVKSAMPFTDTLSRWSDHYATKST